MAPPIDWALKARALLLPTPFASVDPAGEKLREAEVNAWLDSRVATPTSMALDALERARTDAYDAMAVHGLLEGWTPPAGPSKAVHPLSARPLGRPFSPDIANGAWKAFWGRVVGDPHALARIDTLAGYKDLFRAWSKAALDTKDPDFDLTLLPTDAALADCPVWAHRRLASALAGAFGGGGRPALLYLHLGPVQSFIEAARRTHDLWMGSFLLNFLALQAARAVADRLGADALVHPDIATLPLGRKVLFGDDVDATEMLRVSIVNRVLAVVPESHAKDVAEAAMRAIHRTWETMAESVRTAISKGLRGPRKNDWKGFEEQRDGHLDMDAVVVPWPKNRGEAEALFRELSVTAHHPSAPITALRSWPGHLSDRAGFAFGPLFDLTYRVHVAHRATFTGMQTPPAQASAPADDYRPKCTQCGLREQMGPCEPEARDQHGASREFWKEVVASTKGASLQIDEGEGLCVICLTKRFVPKEYFGAEQGDSGLGLSWDDDRALLRFPSTASIASAPFRRLLQEKAPTEALVAWAKKAKQVSELRDFTPPGNQLRGLGPLGRGNTFLSQDGSWLYEASYDPKTAWADLGGDRWPQSDSNYSEFLAGLTEAHRFYGDMRRAVDEARPSPYLAVLHLDGDKWGEWITGRHRNTPKVGEILAANGASLDSPASGEKRAFFPALLGEISRRLAILGQDLHAIADRHLGRVVYAGGDDLLAFVPLWELLPCLRDIRDSFRKPEHLGDRVTISAGVAVAHFRDPLGRALHEAREAEKDAKAAGGDHLSIRLLKRAGAELRVVLPWETSAGSTVAAIQQLVSHRASDGDDQDDPHPLKSPNMVYELREEMRTLGDDAGGIPVDAYLHRLAILLGYKRKSDGYMPKPLPGLLGALGRRKVLDVLLLARFLLREREAPDEETNETAPAKDGGPA